MLLLNSLPLNFIFLIINGQTPIPFQNCGGSLPAVVTGVTVKQSFENGHAHITFRAIGSTSISIAGGTGTTAATVFGLNVYKDQSDLCSYLGACPQNVGSVTATKIISIDKLNNVWGVDINGRMEWRDQNTNLIGCVTANFAIMQAGGMDAVASGIIYALTIGITVLAGIASYITYSASSHGSTIAPHASPSPSAIELILFFQSLAQTGYLNLNYPDTFQQIVAKFGWSNFMPNIGFLKNAAQSIRSLISPATNMSVTSTTGFSGYAQIIGLNPHDLFLYVVVVLLFVIVVWTIVAFLFSIVLIITAGLASRYSPWLYHRLANRASPTSLLSIYFGNVLRIFYLSYFALVATSVFQFTLTGDNWLLYVLAGIILLGFCIGLCAFLSVDLLRYRQVPELLYTEKTNYLTFGVLYNHYRERAYAFFIIFLIYRLLTGIVIGASPSAIVQLCLLFVTELSYLFLLAIKQPMKSPKAQILNYSASFIRLVAVGLIAVFLPNLGISLESRAIIGYVILALHVIAMLLNMWVVIVNVLDASKLKKEMKLASADSRGSWDHVDGSEDPYHTPPRTL